MLKSFRAHKQLKWISLVREMFVKYGLVCFPKTLKHWSRGFSSKASGRFIDLCLQLSIYKNTS